MDINNIDTHALGFVLALASIILAPIGWLGRVVFCMRKDTYAFKDEMNTKTDNLRNETARETEAFKEAVRQELEDLKKGFYETRIHAAQTFVTHKEYRDDIQQINNKLDKLIQNKVDK